MGINQYQDFQSLVMTLSSCSYLVRMFCFFPPFARYHLNMLATSNWHFGQCCEERCFHAVEKFDNIIVLCWFSLPVGAHCFFFRFYNNWTVLTNFVDWLWITKSEQSLYLWICVIFFSFSRIIWVFLNCYEFLWSVIFHCI